MEKRAELEMSRSMDFNDYDLRVKYSTKVKYENNSFDDTKSILSSSSRVNEDEEIQVVTNEKKMHRKVLFSSLKLV